MTNHDGWCEENGTNNETHNHECDEWSLEAEGVCHNKTADGECVEEVADAVSQQVEVGDSFASRSHRVMLGAIHLLKGRRMPRNSTSGYRFVGSNRVR